MARPGEAVNTAMFASLIGVDRPVEGNVWRLIPGDNASNLFAVEGRSWTGSELVIEVPAIVKGAVGEGFEPTCWVA